MQRFLEKIQCPKCEKTIRPPFSTCTAAHLVCNHCRHHQDGKTGGAADSTNCKDQEMAIPLALDKIFKTAKDKCQYGCGFQTNLLDINAHENQCYKHEKLVNCVIQNCQWYSGLSKLIKHVENSHSTQLMDLSSSSQNFIISLGNPIALVANIDRKCSDNEIYWLRLHQEGKERYLMLLHQGPTKVESSDDQNLKICYISSVDNEDLSVKVKIMYTTNPEEDIMNNAFMVSKGIRITPLEGDTFAVKAKYPAPGLILDAMLKDMECCVCTNIMEAPIIMCTKGHSTCGECASRVEKCPTCNEKITEVRNYALEQLAVNVMALNKTKKVVQKAAGTDEKIVTRCVKAGCFWKGPYREITKHWEEKHSQWMRTNVEPFTDDNLSSHYLYNVVGNNFVLAAMGERNGYYYFSVHHVTQQKKTHFYFELDFSNPETGLAKRFTGPCQASTGDDIRKYEYRNNVENDFEIPIEWFDDVIRDDNGEFTRTLNIYPP